MSLHIKAQTNEIADTVLLPGDPLRAKWIAETYFENPKCYNDVRNMFGYTGTYKGKKVSVQGTGMGLPSFSIYAHELINDYDAKKLIRVGSAGSMQEDVALRDVVLAMSASTNSAINRSRFDGGDFAPTASFNLFQKAVEAAKSRSIQIKAGNVLSSDLFYTDQKDDYKKWAAYNVLCVEMEAAALYSIAAKFGVEALAILTISDSLVTGEVTSAEDRETTFSKMIDIALDVI
ncbi:purine-nucleoside phosphorylase [Psychroflexus sp. ALD_RP9]|uniref:purine-nucleoside phosphorylase n=1 Tax=Psychroflexus sp. ALD_RP9 TaxID=2777186 RepID=UPI001A8E1C9A|nr:purine-nucleoside phosphorylase [Psychroflexus sp. ALD_RP9]QSS97296.1 purine-nucleoside phosphorylase [Psychroflexus sp. ALD_RP9]